MKITFFVSGNVRSNFSYRIVALATALHKLGNEVTIVAPKADKYNDFIAENIADINGVKVLQPFQFTTRRPEINLFPYLFGAFNALRKEKPDLIYIYKSTPISIVGLLGKFFWRIPVIVDIDDLGSEVMKIEGHPYHQRKLVAWSERLAICYADRLVVASTYLFDMYHREFPKKPIHLMSNGVDPEWFEKPIASHATKTIVFLGALNRKSILEPLLDVLPKIIEQVPETQVLIIGDGKYLPYFKQKSEYLKINKNITFTGWLSLSDARARLHKGDIGYGYMPNETTVIAANNMKISQYMARGVVPIVSDIGDLPTMVNFGKVGYIAKANDLEALETVLLSALNDKDRFEKAEQTRLFSLKKFSWDTFADDFNRWINIQA
jgi:glycosyltransferase involved in cell wall biosynthesis